MTDQDLYGNASIDQHMLDAFILIVDDQRANVLVLRTVLEAAGFSNVHATLDPREGLEILKSYQPDLILLDLHMPHMNGFEFMEQVKLTPGVGLGLPILVLTADTDRRVMTKALAGGAKDFLTKPLDASEALMRIRNLLETHFLHKSLYEQNQTLEELVKVRTQHLRNSEAQNRAIIEKNVDGMMVLDGKGKALFVNPAAEALFGRSLEDLNGQFSSIPKGGGEGVELPVVRPDGTQSVVELRSSHIRWKGEDCWLSSLRDVTGGKVARESLRTANEELARALSDLQIAQSKMIEQERLGALGRMAGGIAHDFNNALSPILGFSELLLTLPGVYEDRQTAMGFIETINRSAQDAAAIVSRLRQFYRPNEQHDELLPLILHDVIKQSIDLTQPKWKDFAQSKGRTIQLETEIESAPIIHGSEAELREVLTNLIFNAVDAMPEGGTLTLALRTDETSAILEVRDTGTGMTKEVRRACLEPFFTTKGEHGTGLGLAMVFGIIQRHGGTIDIQSEPGEGTSFFLRLPILKESGYTGKADSGPMKAYRHLRILVVDDEENIHLVLRAYLEGDGHHIECAKNGLEGLDKFMQGRYDLVITDQAMPEMGGDQLAVAIKKLAPDKPIIMLSGHGVFMKGEGQKPAGVDLVLSKPVTRKTLQKGIAKMMGA
ncbi:MAG: response regulator [Planctomycetota bacterium]|nr:response regulator [Planctomycetota bacterium]